MAVLPNRLMLPLPVKSAASLGATPWTCAFVSEDRIAPVQCSKHRWISCISDDGSNCLGVERELSRSCPWRMGSQATMRHWQPPSPANATLRTLSFKCTAQPYWAAACAQLRCGFNVSSLSDWDYGRYLHFRTAFLSTSVMSYRELQGIDRCARAPIAVDRTYRQLWWRAAAAGQNRGVFFIPVMWGCIHHLSYHTAKRNSSYPFANWPHMLADLWNNGVDWRRRHFVALNLCSELAVDQFFQVRNWAVSCANCRPKGSVEFRRRSLTVFVSRLEALEAAATYQRMPMPRTIAIPCYQGYTNHQWEHFSAPPVLHSCARSPNDARSHSLSFRGTCANGCQARRSRSTSSGANTAMQQESYRQLNSGRTTLITALQQEALQQEQHAAILRGTPAIGLNVSCQKEAFEEFAELVCDSHWTLTPSGVYPPTYMMYEALHAGSAPLYVFFEGRSSRRTPTALANPETPLSDECPDELALKKMSADQIDALMPFYDEGVRFSEIGAVLLAPTVEQVLRTVNTTAAEMQKRRVRMQAVASLFTPNGTFAYMLRRTSRLA